MAIPTNCESVTRRDCLRLGLGALFGGGLIDALRLRGLAATEPRLGWKLTKAPQPTGIRGGAPVIM